MSLTLDSYLAFDMVTKNTTSSAPVYVPFTGTTFTYNNGGNPINIITDYSTKREDMFSITTARTLSGVVGQVLFGDDIVWESSPEQDDADLKNGKTAGDKARAVAKSHLRQAVIKLLEGQN